MKAGLGTQALEMGHERQNRLIVPKSEVLTWSIVDARQGIREPCLAPDLEEGPVKRDSNEKGEKVGSPAQRAAQTQPQNGDTGISNLQPRHQSVPLSGALEPMPTSHPPED